jgi:hypothetical protein
MANDDLESWRPALIAFYRSECWFQSADNLERLGFPLSVEDRRTIRALQAASAATPANYRRAA